MSPADLDGPECSQGEAMGWLLLAAAWAAGAAITGGWVLRAAWSIAHDPAARQWLSR